MQHGGRLDGDGEHTISILYTSAYNTTIPSGSTFSHAISLIRTLSLTHSLSLALPLFFF